MSFLKTILRFAARLVAGLLAGILLYLGAAWLLSRLHTDAERPVGSDVFIYLKTNGVHTDLVVPVRHALKDWRPDLAFAHTRSGDTTATYVGIGWGDKGFYLETPTWADLKASTAFKAAFGLGGTALHATFYNGLREGRDCIRLPLRGDQYQRLVRYIENSFDRDATGSTQWIQTAAVYGEFDAFYEAKGAYSLFHTCNTWANDGLKACGQKACRWTPFDRGIFALYR